MNQETSYNPNVADSMTRLESLRDEKTTEAIAKVYSEIVPHMIQDIEAQFGNDTTGT